MPGGDFFADDAVGEVEMDGDLAEGGQPGEFAAGLEGGEGCGVVRLEGGDGGWEGEGFGVQGGPEEVGEDLGG